MTEAEIRKIVRDEISKIEKERAALPASDWAKQYIQKAIDRGFMAENRAGSIDRPRAMTERQELATVVAQLWDRMMKEIYK